MSEKIIYGRCKNCKKEGQIPPGDLPCECGSSYWNTKNGYVEKMTLYAPTSDARNSPSGYVSSLACIGERPEHRDHIWGDSPTFTFYAPKIDPSAIVGAFVSIDAGIERPTWVGAHTLIMKHAHLGHDVIVGDNCEIGVHVCLSGNVTVGDNVRIGGNAWVKPRVTIGNGAVIGGGAVVVKDVPAGEVWVGNPARVLKRSRVETDLELFNEQYESARSHYESHA